MKGWFPRLCAIEVIENDLYSSDSLSDSLSKSDLFGSDNLSKNDLYYSNNLSDNLSKDD